MILVITYSVINSRTGIVETLTSHGVDLETDKIVTLPPAPPASLGAMFSNEYGEWILK